MSTSRGSRLALALVAAALLAGCGVSVPHASRGRVLAVGAENEYANVIAQVGGPYVSTRAIESDPNTDPHDFEASPSVAATVAAARLVVQNGLGYDAYMNHIEAANPGPRKVIDVQRLLGLPDSAPNPHLWYSPATMPAVAGAVARALAELEPAHARYFAASARRFDASLAPWRRLLARLAALRPHPAAAVTEPVGDYLLAAAGVRISTPLQFQADIMNGIDPAPQQVSLEQHLLAGHRVQVFLYNQQVTDSLTESFLATARSSGVPVVGVYETMPAGYDYQSWMLAETRALQKALRRGVSTERL